MPRVGGALLLAMLGSGARYSPRPRGASPLLGLGGRCGTGLLRGSAVVGSLGPKVVREPTFSMDARFGFASVTGEAWGEFLEAPMFFIDASL